MIDLRVFALVAASLVASGATQAAQPFACAIQPDGVTVKVSTANPYKADAQCSVNCRFSTAKAGTTFSISCSRSVEAGGQSVELCSRVYEGGKLVKMLSGEATCTDPTPASADDPDDDIDVESMSDPAKLQDRIRGQLPPEAQRMLDKMRKP